MDITVRPHECCPHAVSDMTPAHNVSYHCCQCGAVSIARPAGLDAESAEPIPVVEFAMLAARAWAADKFLAAALDLWRTVHGMAPAVAERRRRSDAARWN